MRVDHIRESVLPKYPASPPPPLPPRREREQEDPSKHYTTRIPQPRRPTSRPTSTSSVSSSSSFSLESPPHTPISYSNRHGRGMMGMTSTPPETVKPSRRNAGQVSTTGKVRSSKRKSIRFSLALAAAAHSDTEDDEVNRVRVLLRVQSRLPGADY